MKKYKIISIDLFQTLIDIEGETTGVWSEILQDRFTESLCETYSNLAIQYIVQAFHCDYSKNDEFKSLEEIFTKGYKKMINDYELPLNLNTVIKAVMKGHKRAKWYEDALSFIEKIHKAHQLCLVTDADQQMIGISLDLFDHCFVSEEIKCYKHHLSGRMFQSVLDYYSCEPSDILHIGDASSDINGAGNMGIDTCWINRKHVQKKFKFPPKYSVNSLDELLDLLNVK